MIISQLIQVLEDWAPRWAALKSDNVGLQIGDPQRRVTKVLIALEITPSIIDEALAKKTELIITHHPLLFRPPSSITSTDPVGKLILRLVENRIGVYSAHTNLDFTKDGVSFALAKKLNLQKIRFLSPLKETLAKIVVFVPEDYAESVRNAMADAGGGIIGEYSRCSFVSRGTGFFRGSKNSSPFIGTPETEGRVEELRLEMIAPRANVDRILSAMKDVHPYEEPAYDVYETATPQKNFGMGALGELPSEQSLKTFLKSVKHALHAEALRFAGNPRNRVRRIAVCGGAGSDLLPDALRAHADVLVTADVRYHTFQAVPDTLALVDAGHWETEQCILRSVADRLAQAAGRANAPLKVFITEQSTNPIHIL
jgi:dinuclear metal center YbgI/SA1388 family protein